MRLAASWDCGVLRVMELCYINTKWWRYVDSISTVLASSGIDYNIKIWEPVSEDLCSLDNLDEVLAHLCFRLHMIGLPSLVSSPLLLPYISLFHLLHLISPPPPSHLPSSPISSPLLPHLISPPPPSHLPSSPISSPLLPHLISPPPPSHLPSSPISSPLLSHLISPPPPSHLPSSPHYVPSLSSRDFHVSYEIIDRNEAMLRENRNTITLPPTFILWILAYLQRRRRRGIVILPLAPIIQ